MEEDAHLGIESSSVTDVSLKFIGREFRVDGSISMHVNVDDVGSEFEVDIGIALVENDEEEIETRHDRS